MMKQDKYQELAEKLIEVCNIAINVIEEVPPREWSQSNIEQAIDTYTNFIEQMQKPDPKYKNLKSLKYIEDDIFILFQEGHWVFVNLFWERVRESNLPFYRINKLEKILKNKKIKNKKEYDYVVDTIISFYQEGIISKEEYNNLNSYIDVFEKNIS